MNLLKIWFNPEASKVMEGANVVYFLANNSGEPTKFHEVYNHPEPDSKVKCRKEICK
jgi:hypothetical protein